MHMLWNFDNQIPTGNQIANTTTATAFASQVPIIWSNTDAGPNAGRAFRLRARGFLSTVAAPGTLTIQIKLGSQVLSQFTTGTAPAPALPASLGNADWEIMAEFLIAATGTNISTGGHLAFMGRMDINNGGTVLRNALLPNSTTALTNPPGTGTANQIQMNTQTAASLSIVVTFSVANTGQNITLHHLDLEEVQ